MSKNRLLRVEQVCADLATTGHRVTFTAVAEATRIAGASLYRNKQLRAVIDEYRTRQTDARTLTDLVTEVAHLLSPVRCWRAYSSR